MTTTIQSITELIHKFESVHYTKPQTLYLSNPVYQMLNNSPLTSGDKIMGLPIAPMGVHLSDNSVAVGGRVGAFFKVMGDVSDFEEVIREKQTLDLLQGCKLPKGDYFVGRKTEYGTEVVKSVTITKGLEWVEYSPDGHHTLNSLKDKVEIEFSATTLFIHPLPLELAEQVVQYGKIGGYADLEIVRKQG